MEEKVSPPPRSGKRLYHPARSGVWGVICGVFFSVVLLTYIALSLWVGLSGKVLPGVWMAGEPMGLLSPEDAAQRASTAAAERFAPVTVSLTYGNRGSAVIFGTYANIDREAAARSLYTVGREGHPITYGWQFLSRLFSPVELPPTLIPDPDSPYARGLLETLFSGHETPPVQTVWTTGEYDLLVTRGIPGLAFDRAAVSRELLGAIARAAGGSGTAAFHVDPVPVPPEPVDWQVVADGLTVFPADARLDPDTAKIVDAVVGVSLDAHLAEERFSAARPGESFTVPLSFSMPEVTRQSLEQTLFRDLLGEASSKVTGSANRKKNVALVAQLIHDTILLPGTVFSYNDTTGPRSEEKGFLPAPSYLDGLTVDSIGGGVCQGSSTVYYAALNANLAIVERRNHSFGVSYLPDGMDATVVYGVQDFRFQNNTGHPIRLMAETRMVKNVQWLDIKIYGVKEDDTYVKMESRRLATYPAGKVYKADPSVPAGTTKESVSPYTGRKVESYRCIYDGEGTLLSRTLESVNTYKKRDQVILYNPADAYLYDPAAAPTPTPTQEAVSPPPAETPAFSPQTSPTTTGEMPTPDPSFSLEPSILPAQPSPVPPPQPVTPVLPEFQSDS